MKESFLCMKKKFYNRTSDRFKKIYFLSGNYLFKNYYFALYRFTLTGLPAKPDGDETFLCDTQVDSR